MYHPCYISISLSLYISKSVFLGGSMINHGGQNPIEPSRLGCTIYHGPHINNFKEIYSYLAFYNISKKIKIWSNKSIKIEDWIKKYIKMW